jgi:WD40 repeat protein
VICVWDMPSQTVLRHLTNSSGRVAPMQFLAGGSRLLVQTAGDNSIRELDVTTGQEIRSWPVPADVTVIKFSPDDRFCIMLRYSGGALLKNLNDDSLTRLDLETSEATDATFSPDGKLFAVGSAMGYARIWETTSWREIATLRGFLRAVHSVAFSADGTRLAMTSGSREALKLWDTASWQELLTLEGDGPVFDNVEFSENGNVIGALSWTGTLNLWRAPSWAEIHAAEAKVKMEAQQP